MSNEISLSGNGGRVIFKVRPKISISKAAMYVNQGLPGVAGLMVYTVTNNKKYTFNTKFVSRTPQEAKETGDNVRLLESWLIASKLESHKPSLITLSGYKDRFNFVPLVMSDINISYDDESDYIDSGKELVPIILPISFSLIESHSTEALSAFDIGSFRNGFLGEF